MGGAWKDYTVEGKSVVRPVLIETGTYKGDNVARALAAGFERVYTIEVSGRWAAAARERYASDRRVTVQHGSSRSMLRGVCDPNVATTFYLDGHFQGYSDFPDEQDVVSECPVLDELRVITAVPWVVKPIVVIDDAHLFGDKSDTSKDDIRARGLNPDHWPARDEIFMELPPGYRLVEHDDRLFGLPTDF